MLVKIENGNGETVVSLEVNTIDDAKVAQAFIVDEWKKNEDAKAQQNESIIQHFKDMLSLTGCENGDMLWNELLHLNDILEETQCRNTEDLTKWVKEHNDSIEERVDEFVRTETRGDYETLQDIIDENQNMRDALSEIYSTAQDYAY